MKTTIRLKTTLLALAALAASAFAGDYSTWSSYRQVTVNTSAMSMSASVTNIPILVRFNATDHADMLNNGSTQIQPNGTDVRVTLADGTTDVPFEIERATTGANGALVLWVKAPLVAQNSTTAATFRVFWGKTGQTTMSNSQAVFDTTAGYLAVWHMNDAITAAGDTIRDATAGNNKAVTGVFGSGAVVPYDTVGVAGVAKKIGATANAVGGYFEAVDPDSSLSVNTDVGPYTISAWVNVTTCANGSRSAIISKYNNSGAASTRQFALQIAGGASNWNLTNNPPSHAATVNEFNASTPCATNQWQYVSASYYSPTLPTADVAGATAAMRISVNNAGAITYGTFTQTAATIGRSSPLRIGSIGDNQRFLRGSVDEVRLSKIVRDSDWVEIEYETQRPTGGTAVIIGATTTPGGNAYTAWTGHRDIVLNTSATGANVATDVLNFPVLVRLGPQESAIIAAANGGNSIRFSKAGDVTALPYQIEHWSSTAAAIWVKVDTVKGNNSTQLIRMHWGNGSAVSESNGMAVFDTANGFVAAWHLGNTSGTTPRPNVITGAPSAIVRNVTGAYQPIPGIIGMADSLPGGAGQDTVGLFGVVRGTRPYIDMRGPYAGYNNLAAGASYSIWVNPNAVPGTNGFARFLQMTSTDSINNPLPANSRLAFLRHSGNGGSLAVRNGNEGGGNSPAIAMPAGAWMHLAFSKTGSGNTKIYVNGDSVHTYTSDNSALVNTDRTNTWIGRSWDQANEYLNAKVDNVVLSKVGRPSAWFKLAYQSQKAVNSLTNIGIPVAPGAPTGVSAVAGNAQATVTWVAPASNGGAPITGYTATSTPGSLTCTTTGALTCNVTGLTNGTGYTFTVTATNAAGNSVASSASASVTPLSPVGGAFSAWSGHRTIVMNTSATGANVAGTVTNFPVLVRLGSQDGAILSAAKVDGADIRFSKANDTTPLPYQIDRWTSTAAAIWVLVDSVKGNNATQTIRMHYGNAAANSLSNGAAVFDTANGFRAVYHLGEASGNVADATGIAANAGIPSAAAPVDTLGLIGRAKAFNGSTNWYQIGTDSTAVNLNTYIAGLTISSWVNPTSCDARIAAFAKYVNGATPAGRQYALHTGNTTTNWRFTVGSTSPAGVGNAEEFFADAESACVTGTWKHIVGTYASAGAPTVDSAVNVRIYVDGAFVASGSSASVTGVGRGANTYIGRIHNDQRYMNGLLDEITVAAVRRDSNWIKLAYQNQKAQNGLVDIGNLPVTVPGAPGTPSAALTGTTGSVAISWTAPSNTGNGTITGYTVSIASGTPNTGTCTTTGALTCTISGLTVGNSYTFTVRATNSAGQGAASTASASITVTTGILPGSFVIRMDGTNPYSYRIPASTAAVTEELTMTISDVHGKRVWNKTINPSTSRVAEITWNGHNTNGVRVSAGMYIVRVSAKMDGQTVEAVRKGVNLK